MVIKKRIFRVTATSVGSSESPIAMLTLGIGTDWLKAGETRALTSIRAIKILMSTDLYFMIIINCLRVNPSQGVFLEFLNVIL